VGYFVYTVKEFLEGINAIIGTYRNFNFFRKMAFLGATDGHYAGISMFFFRFFAKGKSSTRYKKYKTFNINLPFENIIRQMNEFQPVVIVGNAFGLNKLAEYQKAGILKIRPKSIISGGEPLSNENRSFMESVFNISIKDIYASSEMLVTGVRDKQQEDMVLMEDNIYFETTGSKILMTNLFNYTLPLIRYETSDKIKIVENSSDKISFVKTKEIIGREEITPYFLNDSNKIDFISPMLLVDFFVKGLKCFQMRMIDNRNFEFFIVFENNLNQEEKEETKKNIIQKWKDILQKKQMTQVNFILKEADVLNVNKVNGKFQLII
jgi:phenylacetate-CoA ligase